MTTAVSGVPVALGDVTLEPVIGLEIHAQLLTRSKMFCGCSASYTSAPPNSHVCAVCGGMPGALPVINAAAVEFAVRVALALNCSVAGRSWFDRKNYSYPDLPKGYQISQYDTPLGLTGWIDFDVEGAVQHCGITRVHLEEDTGKTSHVVVEGQEVSLVDYNRSGVPLLEIVGEPELRSPEQARRYFETLRQTLMYLGVNDGNLQEGSLRADVNVSMRRPGAALPETKVEIKNLNSFRAVQRSLEYEIERQRRILMAGERVAQETRGWSESEEVTLPQRSKEYAHDYRYFPEPDLPPLDLSAEFIEGVRRALPELARERSARFVRELEVPEQLAVDLTRERALADYFEATLHAAPGMPATNVAHWVLRDVTELFKEHHMDPLSSPVTPDRLGALLELIDSNAISSSAGKIVLPELFASDETPQQIVERLDLLPIRDTARLVVLIDEILSENPSLVDKYRKGKTNMAQAVVGKLMAATRNKADPVLASGLVHERLNASD